MTMKPNAQALAKRQLSKIHCLKKELELSEQAYRDLLNTMTGKSSAKDLNATERGNVIRALRQRQLADMDCENGTLRQHISVEISKVLNQLGSSKNYANEIARRMFNGHTQTVTVPELGEVLKALQMQLERQAHESAV